MKHWFSVFVLLAVFSGGVQAETTTMGGKAEEFAQKLGLDEQQMKEVKAILKESFEGLRELRDESISKFEKLRELRDNTKETNASLDNILSDEQMDKFKELRSEFISTLKEQRKAIEGAAQ